MKRTGFTHGIDLQLQLATLSQAELLHLVQGRAGLSTAELIGCFDWTFAASAEAGFGQAELRLDTPAPLLVESSVIVVVVVVVLV